MEYENLVFHTSDAELVCWADGGIFMAKLLLLSGQEKNKFQNRI